MWFIFVFSMKQQIFYYMMMLIVTVILYISTSIVSICGVLSWEKREEKERDWRRKRIQKNSEATPRKTQAYSHTKHTTHTQNSIYLKASSD